MARWELLSREVAQQIWDEELVRLADYSAYQTYAWGEYRRGLGWEPCHWVAHDDEGRIVAMMLGNLRRYPFGLGLVYCEGGPAGNLSVCDETLQQAIKQTTRLRYVYCRFRSHKRNHVEDALQLTALGWTRAWFPLTTCYSMILDLNRTEEELRKGLSRNWLKNLKRAENNNLTVRLWDEPDADEVMAIVASMEKVKNLPEQFSRDEIEQVVKHLKDSFVLYRCDDEHGQLLSVSGYIVVGNRGMHWLAACGERGRKTHASFVVYWAMLKHCLSLKLDHLDMAGIDPVNNEGVLRFKKGCGGAPIEYLGEWDWASREWMRWLGNWAISRRERLKKAEATLKTSARERERETALNTEPGAVATGFSGLTLKT